MSKKNFSVVSNSSVTNHPTTNQQSNLPSEQATQDERRTESVLRTDHAPPEPTETSDAPHPIESESHELANLFPMLGAVEFQALCDDIAKNGQLEPITMLNGKIVDGRNRWMACKVLGIKPKTVELSINPLNLVIANNVRRRQLTKSQLAMVAMKLAILSEKRPELGLQNCAVSQDEAADLLGVSRAYVRHAQKVCTEAIPEVAALVESGKLPVNTAAKLADATSEQQLEAVEVVKKGGKCHTFKPPGEKKGGGSLKIHLAVWMKSALDLPLDSQERVDELAKLFKTLSAEAFGKNTPRKEFLKRIIAECAEYGIEPPIYAAEVEHQSGSENAGGH
jgi:ParB-like chromosome segregation protein Spo0J